MDSIITFDSEVFNETMDRVIIGGLDENGVLNPDLVTYAFDMSNDYVPSNSQEYTVIAKIDVVYYWVYLLRPDESRDRRQMHSFPAQIALKTK